MSADARARVNVVATLDVVRADGALLLVMDYVEGESLARLSRLQQAPLPTSIAVTIMAGALDGLHAAHEATSERGEPLSIVHGDVSPRTFSWGATASLVCSTLGSPRPSARVSNPGGQACFVEQHGGKMRIGRQEGVQALDRHRPAEACLREEATEVHGGHPTRRELVADEVAANGRRARLAGLRVHVLLD